MLIILFKGAIKFQQKLSLIFIANFYLSQYWVDIYLIFTFTNMKIMCLLKITPARV